MIGSLVRSRRPNGLCTVPVSYQGAFRRVHYVSTSLALQHRRCRRLRAAIRRNGVLSYNVKEAPDTQQHVANNFQSCRQMLDLTGTTYWSRQRGYSNKWAMRRLIRTWRYPSFAERANGDGRTHKLPSKYPKSPTTSVQNGAEEGGGLQNAFHPYLLQVFSLSLSLYVVSFHSSNRVQR